MEKERKCKGHEYEFEILKHRFVCKHCKLIKEAIYFAS